MNFQIPHFIVRWLSGLLGSTTLVLEPRKGTMLTGVTATLPWRYTGPQSSYESTWTTDLMKSIVGIHLGVLPQVSLRVVNVV